MNNMKKITITAYVESDDELFDAVKGIGDRQAGSELQTDILICGIDKIAPVLLESAIWEVEEMQPAPELTDKIAPVLLEPAPELTEAEIAPLCQRILAGHITRPIAATYIRWKYRASAGVIVEELLRWLLSQAYSAEYNESSNCPVGVDGFDSHPGI